MLLHKIKIYIQLYAKMRKIVMYYIVFYSSIFQKKKIWQLKSTKLMMETQKKINPIYSVRLSLEEWNRLTPDKSEFKDMSVIFQKLSKVNNKNCSLKFHDNSLDLVLKLVDYSYEPMKIALKQEIERKDLNPNKIIEQKFKFK